MAETLTLADYEARKAGFVAAISRAETDYQDAQFKVTTGTGEAAAVEMAKQHLEGLQDQLASLEAAWQGAVRAGAEQARNARRKAFDAYRADVDKRLGERVQALSDIRAAMADVIAAHGRFTAASAAIREASQPVFANVGGSLSGPANGVLIALKNAADVASLAISDALDEAGIQHAGASDTMRARLRTDGIKAIEAGFARRIREASALLAPAGVEL